MFITEEKTENYNEIYNVVKEAFAAAQYSDGDEHNLVSRLRKSKSYIPELSLIAIEDKKIVGHIMFTRSFVNDEEVLALAPLSVLPEYQNMGIGLALINYGHDTAKKSGFRYSVVLGHSKYYPKAGYVPASRYGIKPPFEIDDENFMAVCFDEKKEKLNGIMKYDAAFGI